RRLRKLENMECASIGKNRVVAPFVVVDRAGKKVFSVIEKAAGLFNSSGQSVARMVATPQGGLFVAGSESTSAFFGIKDSVSGLGLSENNQLRVELGRNPQSESYRLNFRGAS